MYGLEAFDWKCICIVGSVDWGGPFSCGNGVMAIVNDGGGEIVGIVATDISICRFPGEV